MIKNRYEGKFIVFEGLDGSGKSTQAGLLAKKMNKNSIKSHKTFEPTQYLIGGLIRSFLANDWKSSPDCLQLLFAADRAYHLEKEIFPALKKRINVVCDRYFFSSFAYGALDCDLDWLIKANDNFLLPDLTIILKSDPDICMKRMAKERFSVELFEKVGKLQKVWENYLRLVERFKSEADIRVINGDRPVPEIFEEVEKIIAGKKIDGWKL
ncbi:MAG TPA: dTMP kinase [Candidatus Paceibacterota bacterium]|nr:dTMP kinase [Candidatus Pacearchaeota archaeon]HRZ50521.1 dTMP kinase [Candidatus Paceibacterota bacterium]HSA36242.1 dTMP kinase [Candidatus Paceibacterota bacterium]